MGLFDDPIPVQQYNPASGILGAQAPMPEYDVSLRPVADFSKALALGAYESAQIPAKGIRGEYGILSPENPLLTDAAAQFTMDFGLLPAVGMSAIAKPDANTLRMGMGGADTVSGGVRQQPSLARDVDDLGFYSQALEAAKGFSQLKGTGDQYRAMLLKAGVKPDEITFTPELEGLLSQPQVTKDELVGLLQDNRIRPQETVYYGGDTPEYEGLNFPREGEVLEPDVAYGREYIDEEREYMMEVEPDTVADLFASSTPNATEDDIRKVRTALDEGYLDLLVNRESDLFVDNDLIYNVIEQVEDAAEALVLQRYYDNPVFRYTEPNINYEIIGSDDIGYGINTETGDGLRGERYSVNEAIIEAEADALERGLIGEGGGETRFMEYTEAGGDNYREMMLQVPEYAGKTDEFVYSGHFDEPDIVVHARTKDRDSANDVGDVLYVEELQSDFAQQGRKQGFKGDLSEEEIAKLEVDAKDAQSDYIKAKEDYYNAFNSFGEKLAAEVNKTSPAEVFYDKALGVIKYVETPFNNASMRPLDSVAFRGDQVRWMLRTGEPMSYTDVQTLKETPIEALDLNKIRPENIKGLDERAEITERVQNDLSNRLYRARRGLQPAPFVKNSQKFAEVGVKRLLNQAVKDGKRYVSFSSGDVQLERWNEKGLVPFYDEIIPKVAKKVVKKLDPDAKPDYMPVDGVEDFGGNMGTNRFTIEITPKMKEEILKGQQLFTAPNVPVPASGLLGQEPREVHLDNISSEDLGLLIETYDKQNALPQLEAIFASQGIGIL